MKKAVTLLITLGIMAAIFYFSSQPGTVSETVSETVVQSIQGTGAECLVPGWFSANSFANIRKWAHVYIYLALGASMACTVGSFRPGWRRWQQGSVSALLCLVYAVTDELHQFFVPGRAMLAGDVLVDAMGFSAGILAMLLLFRLVQFCRRHR